MSSLRLCAEAGLVKLGAVALNGTKVGANASPDANRTLAALDKRLAEAAELDALEATGRVAFGGGLWTAAANGVGAYSSCWGHCLHRRRGLIRWLRSMPSARWRPGRGLDHDVGRLDHCDREDPGDQAQLVHRLSAHQRYHAMWAALDFDLRHYLIGEHSGHQADQPVTG